MGWFASRTPEAVRDFWEVFETLRGDDAAYERRRAARAGDWAPLEEYMRSVGASYARGGHGAAAWQQFFGTFYAETVPRYVAAYAATPERLSAALLVLGEFFERSLATIAGAYYETRFELGQGDDLRHAQLIDASLDPVIAIDDHGVVREFNAAAERTFGFRRSDALGRPLAELVIPERDRVRHRVGLARHVATGVSHLIGRRVELTARRADGVEFPIELAVVAVRERDGTRRFIGFLRDLTERTQVAARLALISNMSHELAQVAGVEPLLELVARHLAAVIGEACAVRLLSADGQWLEPSQAFVGNNPAHQQAVRAVLGSLRQRAGDGIAGRVALTGEAMMIAEIDPADLVARALPAVRPLLEQIGVRGLLVVPLRTRDRALGVISLVRTAAGRPFTTEDQRLAQDLADRAALAIENAQLVANLEKHVGQRTAALEAANRELEAFSYSVSHDLRAPLRSVDGFARALLVEYDDALDTRGRHYLARIRAGTQRMAGLIDDLLSLARIQRTEMVPTTTNLSAIAQDIVDELRRRDPERATPVHVAPGLAAFADSRLAAVVLDNLLSNAWKFTARNAAAEIWFGCEGETFYVRDTGAGFDMQYVDKLFTPFQRLHAVSEFDGVGVGLAIVARILARHGGKIWAEAAVGRGATFYFTWEA